jgi:uncharacterized low-complexity protein
MFPSAYAGFYLTVEILSMANNSKFVNPVTAAVGVAFVSSLAASTTALADDNPFSTAELDAGYQLAGEKGEVGKCGEGKCGGDKDKGAEGSCGEKGKAEAKGEEGKCGGDKGAEGSCGEKAEAKGAEGKCGEGKCGGDKGEEKGKEGSCGDNA